MKTSSNNNSTAPTGGEEISLTQARETLWPVMNQPPKTDQPMGKLLDAGQLKWRDLGFLAQDGHKPRDRKAAKILLLEQLQISKETSDVIEPPKIISPQNWTYTEIMQHRFALLFGTIIGLIVGFEIFAVIPYTIYNLPKGFRQLTNIHSSTQFTTLITSTIVILIPAVLIFIFFTKVLDRITSKIEEQIENHRKGRIGEEQTRRVMQQALNKNWSIYLNLLLPEKKGADMDAVLVGPAGVWVFEIKNFDGQYRNTGEQWEFMSGTKWKTAKSPTKQAKKNAARLASFLKIGGINKNLYVNPVVVWVNIEKKPTVENALADVWTLDSLQQELIKIDQHKNKFSPDEQKNINDKLESLYKSRLEQVS